MKTLSGAILAAALGSGCASAPPPQSGFLGDYSQLQPAPDRDGVMLYLDQRADLRPFTKLYFDPVLVQVTTPPGQAPLPPDVPYRIAGQFQDSLRRALSAPYRIVAAPGPDVLRVRSAITGIQAAQPAPGASGELPIRARYDAGGGVIEMRAEIEVLDPAGKRAAAATVTRKGGRQLEQGERITWQSLQAITDYWAQNFHARLDQLRAVSPAPVAAAGRH